MSHDVPSVSLIAAFAGQFARHAKALINSPADVANPLLFFFMVVTLFPLGLGPDPERLSSMAPGILWVVALLASLMVSGKLFASDFEDGSLEQLMLSPYPLAILALAEVAAHWFATGALLALIAPVFGVMLGLPSEGLLVLTLSLLLGSVCLTLIGALGSALTVSIRRGGLLLSLLIIPLNVPVLIFGTTAVYEAVVGGNWVSWLALLGGLALGSLALLPIAIGAALRVSVDT
ncbi:MAG: heme exporter protein CcmB [Luminiphilus sp.]|nr:heme exporter protein CcmB [Luminiphilus sp.]